MSTRISYTVEGDVQGVNYRSWAAEKAGGLSITGYAKNTDEGTVLQPALNLFALLLLIIGQVVGEAQGDASAIDKFVQHLKMGPSAATVSKVDHQEIAAKEGGKGFDRL